MTKTILIIEDDELLLRLMVDLFDFHQIKTITATTGNMGIRLSKEYQPDLIICDLRLSDISGIDLIASLYENETTTHIPIIIATAASRDEVRNPTAYSPSVVSIVFKPFSVDVLVDKVKAVLNKKSENRPPRSQFNAPPDANAMNGPCG